MSISSTTYRAQYTSTGTTGPYPFTFPIVAGGITVIITDTSGNETDLPSTSYSLFYTNNNPQDGGAVTLNTAVQSGYTVTLLRSTPQTQQEAFYNGQPTLYESFQASVDQLTMEVQDLQGQLDRTPMLKESTPLASVVLADPMPGAYLGWNPTGTGIQNNPNPLGVTSTGASTVKYLSNYASLAAALTAIGNTPTELVVDVGAAVTANTMIPTNINLVVTIMGGFSISSGVTLTINGAFTAGRYQIFGGAGTVAGLTTSFPEWWGAVGNDEHDDTSAFVSALAAVSVSSPSEFHQRGILHVHAPASAYKITGTLTINADAVTVRGDSAALDFSSMANTLPAIIYQSSGPVQQPYYNGTAGISGLQIKGPGIGGSSVGIQLVSPSFPAASMNVIRDCTIYNFYAGVTYGNNSWAITLDHDQIHDNYYGIWYLASASAAGERNSIINGMVYNNRINIQADTTQDLSVFIIDCSLDSPVISNIVVTAGSVNVIGGHIEDDDSPSSSLPISVTGGMLSLDHVFVNIAHNPSGSTSLFNINGGQFSLTNSNVIVPVNYPTLIQLAAISWYNEFGVKMLYSGTTVPYSIAPGARFNIQSVDSNRQISETSASISSSGSVTAQAGLFWGGGNNADVTALNTWVQIFAGYAKGSYSGPFAFTDGTSGGTALFMVDPVGGAHSVYNGITGFNVQYSSIYGVEIEVTSGTVPRTIYWSVLSPY